MPGEPEDGAVLALLAVAPDAQARGLGRALLNAIELRMSELGYPRAVLVVLIENAPAVRLYGSAGWRPVGEPYAHALHGRPTRVYTRDLSGTFPAGGHG